MLDCERAEYINLEGSEKFRFEVWKLQIWSNLIRGMIQNHSILNFCPICRVWTTRTIHLLTIESKYFECSLSEICIFQWVMLKFDLFKCKKQVQSWDSKNITNILSVYHHSYPLKNNFSGMKQSACILCIYQCIRAHQPWTPNLSIPIWS